MSLPSHSGPNSMTPPPFACLCTDVVTCPCKKALDPFVMLRALSCVCIVVFFSFTRVAFSVLIAESRPTEPR